MQKPLPTQLLAKASKGGWDSESDSNSKNDELFPKSKAVRGKFIYDPEHGGGRRRRDKHLPKQRIYTESMDKIGYDDITNFNQRLGLAQSPNNHQDNKKKKIAPLKQFQSPNPFEIAEEVNRENNVSMEIDSEPQVEIDQSLYANQTGEAEVLPLQEAATDFGLQNMITAEVLDNLMVSK
jgi:hypothetical protein